MKNSIVARMIRPAPATPLSQEQAEIQDEKEKLFLVERSRLSEQYRQATAMKQQWTRGLDGAEFCEEPARVVICSTYLKAAQALLSDLDAQSLELEAIVQQHTEEKRRGAERLIGSVHCDQMGIPGHVSTVVFRPHAVKS
eukprot:CAMPEP_0119108206 /NCGR_PEP_ID=MMETSP1180-20130426/13525_1 /TAXON_ID=3052 ORGANISM="Chlamydomonas cf sp, Strain CCMP681" /NCGR_SAMPLE_ID=MMETSP1180 /ASSEMBLY_ACC=CAM_ASM_000741 /LENGTH=139 /DNA_ID=CAMNT_0007093797 /DNA_START=89 /DNA_END=508 /DNA_ORIENTATION=-